MDDSPLMNVSYSFEHFVNQKKKSHLSKLATLFTMNLLNAFSKSLHDHDFKTTFLAIPIDLRNTLHALEVFEQPVLLFQAIEVHLRL